MKQMLNERLEISESNPIKARRYDYECFVYPWHFHSQYEIIYVKESYGACYVGDCIQQYSAGDMILFGSHLPHYMRSDDVYRTGDATLRVQGTIIQFEQNFMQYSLDFYPQLIPIRAFLEKSKRGILFPKESIAGISSRISDFPDLKGFNQFVALLELLQAMSGIASARILASPNFHEQLPVMGYKRIDKIISYLNNNYTRNLKLSEVAGMAHMNPTAFCRFFKLEAGKPFLQYIADMRLGYACKLLTMGDMDIAQIAIESGFESISNFNRVFKAKKSMTPKQYRAQMEK